MQSKRFLAIAALCAIISLSVTGCGSDSSTKDSAVVTIAATTVTESTIPASSADSEASTTDTASEITDTTDDSSDDAGTVVATYDNNLETYEFEVPEDGTYTFTDPVSADDVFWDIYVLDAQWNDGVRYLKQSQ